METKRAIFIDRDGVLNRRIPDDYVRDAASFEWLPMAKEAFVILAQHFSPIIIVSNQQGVGKRLFSQADLAEITQRFIQEVEEIGGRIDKVYYCTHLKTDNCNCRKPKTGMAAFALNDYPEIQLNESLMIGDSLSDMEFGKNLGMKTIYIATEKLPENRDCVSETFPSLWDFAMREGVY